MKIYQLAAATAVAILLGIGAASAQVDAAKCATAKTDNIEADIRLFCPEADWPKSTKETATPANAATLDEAKCTQAKNDHKADDVKLYCPESEWLPAQ